MEAGKQAARPCCPSGEPCKVPAGKAYCKCEPGWTCVIAKVEPDCCAPSFVCNEDEGCVCITEKSPSKQVVQTCGAYCECGEGYRCTVTKVDGPDEGKAFFECCNGCRCEVPAMYDVSMHVKESKA